MFILRSPRQRKHFFRWLRTQNAADLLREQLPWITFDALLFINDYLGKHRPVNVFEYGSGGSTLYWLSMGAQVVSVEHDEYWYALLNETVKSRGVGIQLDYHLITPVPIGESEPPRDFSRPKDYISSAPELSRVSFQHYASWIDQFPDHFFDVVLVDGRARPSCIMHGAAKVKSNGLLIVDNSDRDYYFTNTQAYLASFERNRFYGVGPIGREMWQTDVFIRSGAQESQS